MSGWLQRLALAAVMLVPSAATADPIKLDFERFPGPDGQLHTSDDLFPGVNLVLLRDQFSSLGVTFSQGTLGQSAFFDSNPGNHFITSTPPIGSFSIPIFGISIQTYSFWDATLTALDASNATLALAIVANPAPGVSPVRGHLSVTSSTPIHRFSVLPASAGQILNLDNMALQTEPSEVAPVPEPSTLLLIGTGLAALCRKRRRRTRTEIGFCE